MPEIIATATVRAITSQTTKEIMELAISKIKGYQALKKLTDNNDDLMASIEKLMWVKTLFSGAEKPVNLFDFFQAPKLAYLEEKIFTIDNLQEISSFTDINNKNLIFRGTVGQGKSILMRFLAIKDIVTTQRIPIFIELKNISKNKSIIDLIKEYLAIWIGDSEEIFNLVMQSGKISIFLDAFDELDPDLIQSTYKYINDLCQNFRKLTVIVSSRPDTLIINSQYFNVIDLQPYESEEQIGLIEKLVEDEDNKNFLIESINNSTHEVQEVLVTPLMVVLFIKQYTVGFSVPNHVVDFYKNIFDVVTFTHDRSKGIEKRQSFSSLNQIQLESVFERFCFETFLAKTTVLSKDHFIALLRKSLEKNNINNFEDYNQLINDFTKFACLILLDGTNYTFIHKSIQEFYVAKYISNLNESTAKRVIEIKFYNEYINHSYLEFLRILRPYYFNKYYLLKGLEEDAKKMNFKYIDNKDNINSFIGNLFVCEFINSNNRAAKVLGVLLFGKVFFETNFMEIHSIIDDLKQIDIVNSSGVFGVEKDDDVDIKKTPLLDLLSYEDIMKLASVKKCWSNICNYYKKVVLEIEEIENQVTEDDLGI
ncbi:NACHT domain-containing protein [Acinetobacter baumannii]|uniref:NACHT domain-containing protein n=1 Tax=Acinetobacter baumannii TaxID=470 RepID=UPI00044C5488|nr:NACHT domain-containing protein [Acinetobacter baumannii]EXH49072.1 NACHT domain protein [Acinetobacter baumannii 1412924]MDC4707326.1 NACHT domain-containing protein [Acinetobacter baumannii]MDO7375715.1 NACHT domain-containing protein [Acinetobacter baumannii]MDO7496469.1 NACHT domain-containing protein [Acinetobacter baumannii]MDO7519725.1 NACHT domain-containing protein [Acinetobacter baumannii]